MNKKKGSKFAPISASTVVVNYMKAVERKIENESAYTHACAYIFICCSRSAEARVKSADIYLVDTEHGARFE